MKSKSAKDIAFEKERASYRKQIRELEFKLKQKDNEILEMRDQLLEAENKCTELQDWVERLLEYTELSEDDMRKIIQKEKDSIKVKEHLNALFGISSKMFSSHYL